MSDRGSSVLTPAQARTLDALRRTGDPLVFDPAVVEDLRAEMTEAVAAFASRLPPNSELFVSKHRLATVLGCEAQHMAPDEFEWTAASARGQVAHRAIQLLVSWKGEAVPGELVEEAMARLIDEDRSIGAWMAGLGPADEADVRGMSVERVTKFMECFPPLDARSHPLTEAKALWPLDGPVVMQAKVDLMIGRPAGAESRKVIVDLKTGRPNVQHRQDLGFYALLETLVRGVPPRKLATFYLDAGEAQVEDVSERLLRSAVRRTLDGINALVELEVEGRPPAVRPGVSCRWCVLADECGPGRAWLDGQRDVPEADGPY
jgi:CRISPR/Cas system-associated exonuclease Cas4 (RecB family)